MKKQHMIMNNNLSKTLFIPTVACPLGARTGSMGPNMEADDNSLVIHFADPAVTRAAIDDADGTQTDGNSFSIWGSYTAVTGGMVTSVFDVEKVTCLSGMWGYEDMRYWLPDNTYDLYALYPFAGTLGDTVSSAACTDGTFTVNGFDATKGYDLMTAKKTGISVMTGQIPGAVALKFQHLLARFTFMACSEGDNVTVRSISLEGLAVKDDYDDSVETAWNSATTGRVSAKKETNVTPAGDTNVSGDLLLIPQPLVGGVKLIVIYNIGAETEKFASYTLPAITVSMREAANHYCCSFILTGGGYIVFDLPTVNARGDAIGGNVIIDVIQ